MRSKVLLLILVWVVLVVWVVGCGKTQIPDTSDTNQPTSEAPSLSKPKGLTATGGDTIVYLTWEANPEPDIEWYYIYCSVGSNDAYGTSIARTKEAYFEHRQLNMGNSYYYKIKACKNGRYSELSDEVSVLPKEKYVLVSEFIERGAEESQLDFPMYMAIDSGGHLYFSDYNRRCVKKYDSSGGFINRWDLSDWDKFGYPVGVAVSKFGQVFVADIGSRIHIFDNSGNYSTSWGNYGSGEGQLLEPQGITIFEDPDKGEYFLFVADSENNCVQKFDYNGNFIAKIDGLWGPHSVAISSKGDVYVGDTNYIHKFLSTDGVHYSLVKRWEVFHGGSQPFNPWFITIDSQNNIYTQTTDRIKKYDEDGNFITEWSIAEMGGCYAIGVNGSGEIYKAAAYDQRYIISKYKKQ
jgi:hypothetical protein